MVFEDRPEIRRSLVGMLEGMEQIRLVGQSGTTWEIVDRVRAAGPDVVLMDLEMPTASRALDCRAGTKAILALREALGNAGPAIVVLTNFIDDERIFEAFCAGGNIGYLAKPASAPTLQRAVLSAARGEPFSSPFVARRVQQLLGNPVIKAHAARLSVREYEALTLLKQGYSQREAAAQMGIASVKDLLKSAYRKLDVHTLRQAENKVWYNHLNILKWLRKE